LNRVHIESDNRKSGIEVIGDIPWGTHFCQFYKTKEDLIDILVPYFKTGLENNEFCMWITSTPLKVNEAKVALGEVVKDLDELISKDQIEILDYSEWYTKSGEFHSEEVLKGWIEKERAALQRDYAGLRLTGNTFWLERNGWTGFTQYESEVNNVIGSHKMIALCSYSLDKCNASEVLDVVDNHQFALARREGRWEILQSLEHKRISGMLERTEKKFSELYSSMNEGVALHDVIYDSHLNVIDYIITDVNSSFERNTGITRDEALGRKASELYGTGKPPYLDVYARVASGTGPERFETYFAPLKKHFSISVFSPEKGKFATVFRDITESKQTEEQLRRHQAEIKTLLENTPAGLVLFEAAPPYKVLVHNRYYQELFAEPFRSKGMVGLNIYEYAPAVEAEGVVAVFDEVIRTKLAKSLLDFPYKPNPPKQSWFNWHLSPLILDDQVVALVSMSLDVTDHHKVQEALKESEEKYRSLFVNMAEQVHFWQLVRDEADQIKTWRLVDINPAGLKGWGKTRAETIGKTADEIFLGATAHFMPIVTKIFTEGAPHSWESYFPALGQFLQMTSVPFGEFFITTGVDITERKRMESLKEQFISAVTHELRTPLVSIKGYIDFLLMDKAELPENITSSLEVVKEQGDRLLRITDDLLDYRRFLSNKFELELSRINLKKVISESIKETEALFKYKKQDLQVEISEHPMWIEADGTRLIQVVSNLLTNASKFTPEGGQIRMSLEEVAGTFKVSISDTGIGIKAEDLYRIFEPFANIEKPTYIKGTGIGLSVAKGIIEAHGGNIWSESEGLGCGSTFNFTIPQKTS
jgi:signal transduction histidine kinase